MAPKTKKLLIWSGIILALLAAGFGVWYFVIRKKDDEGGGKVVPLFGGQAAVTSVTSPQDQKNDMEARQIADILSGRAKVSVTDADTAKYHDRLKALGYVYDETTKHAKKL